IDDAELIVFREESVPVSDTHFHVVDALYVRQACASPSIRQRAVLSNGLQLQFGCLVGKGISARVVVVLILPHETAQREDRLLINQACPRRRDVERSDLRTLILRSYGLTVRSQASAGRGLSRWARWVRRVEGPTRPILRVVRIRRLEPGPAVAKVHVDGIRRRNLQVYAVEKILLIASIVHDVEFRSIEKP